LSEIVVDASALGSVLLPDEDELLGQLALAAWRDGNVRVPAHWPVEVMSVLIKAEKNERIYPNDCESAWIHAASLIQSSIIETTTASAAIFALARRYGLSAQDAGYVELAARLELPLLTGDKAMARAAKSLSIELIFDPT
jgi:predicted nucleic acid-binding protein